MKHSCGAILKYLRDDDVIGQSIYYCPRCREDIIVTDEMCEECGFPKKNCICGDIT